MNTKFYGSLLLIAMGISLNVQAQVSYNKRVMGSIGTVPKAADFQNAASLDNVDYSTGTLKIGIPLYEVKVNDISVPVTLNYSALGLKVGQEAGPAGMGWELAAGGKIVTNMQGRKDGPNFTDFYSESWVGGVLISPSSFDPYHNSAQQSFINGVLDGIKDGLWDTYNYILPHGGGTYVNNGLTFPYDPTISFPHPGRIMTTDGLIYDFSSGDTKKIQKKKYYSQNMAPDPNAWITDQPTISIDQDLSRIISTRYKDTVKFEYERFSEPHAKLGAKIRTTTSESLPLYRDVKPRTVNEGGVINDAESQWYKIGEPIISQVRTSYTAHTRIKSINFPNGRVIFDYAPNDVLGRDVLDSIRIYQKYKNDSTMLKKYVFEKDNQMGYGHYLQALHIYDGKGVWQGAYDFTYYDKLPLNPTAESFQQDRWGYYNAAIGNLTLLEHPDNSLAMKSRPRYPVYNDKLNPGTKEIIYTRGEAIDLYGLRSPIRDAITGISTCRINFADREPRFNSAVLGTLKSVKVPTGGMFEYEYEGNKMTYTARIANYSSTLTYIDGGGIRLKKITQSLNHSNLYTDYYQDTVNRSIKKYVYGNAAYNQSGGANETDGYGIGTMPGTLLANLSKYYDASTPTTDYNINNIMMLAQPVNNLAQYNGSSTIYQSVTEYQMKSSDPNQTATLGKTVYYSDATPEGYRSDTPWDGGQASLEDPHLPYAVDRPGVEKTFHVGVAGFRKYATKPNGSYRITEQNRSLFTSYDAPVNSTNRLISLFASRTGEMNGPFPGTSAVRNDPKPNPLGTGGIYLFNNFVSTGSLGVMDYIAYNNIIQEGSTITYPGKYYFSMVDLNLLSNCVRKTKEEKMIYDDNENTAQIQNTNYYYDNIAHMQPTRVNTLNSKGDSVNVRTRYAADYPANTMGNILDFMKSERLSLTEPVETYTTYRPAGGNTTYVTSGSINTYKQEDNVIYSDKVFQMKVNNELTPYSTSSFNGTESSIDTNVYKKQLSYDLYVKGNVHKYAEQNATANVILWGYDNQYPIAKVINANNISSNTSGRFTNADVAYTSFERPDEGNWTYAGAAVADTTGPSGKKIYKLENGQIKKTNPTPSGVRYLISYWYKNGAAVNVTGGTVGTAVVKNTWNNWTLAEREISNVSGVVTVSGTGYIDELRFHPLDAQMSTYLYEPLIGITDVIDAKGNLQHYEYDDNQRLKNIRDQKGNLVKSYKYQMGNLN